MLGRRRWERKKSKMYPYGSAGGFVKNNGVDEKNLREKKWLSPLKHMVKY